MTRFLILLLGLGIAGCTNSTPAPEASIYHLSTNWTDQRGQTTRLAGLRGRVVVMAMIYTSCQSTCPRLLNDLQIIERKLAPEDLARVQFLLVSIDPDIDTTEKLQAYAEEHRLGRHWRLLRGEPEHVQELAKVMNFRFRKETRLDYSHSDIISVLNGEGELVHQQEGPGQDPARALEAIHKTASALPAPQSRP